MTAEKAKSLVKTEAGPQTSLLPNVAEPLMEAMGTLNGSGIEAASQMNEALLKCGCDALEEMTSFASRRLDDDFEAVNMLRDCRTPVDVLEQQVRFSQRMTRDYSEETRRLTNIFTQRADEIWKPWHAYNQTLLSAVNRACQPR